jgi:transglutaminase-like putative cysteine protease
MVVFADSAEIDPETSELAAVHYDSVSATELRLDSPMGPYRVWVDRRGGVAGLEWPLGMHWVRSDFDLVVRDFRRRARTRVAAIDAALGVLTPLSAPGEAPDTSTSEQRYRIERRDGKLVSGALMVYLTGGRQQMQSGVLRVFAAPERALRTATPDRSFDPLAQDSAPEIRALARRILKGESGSDALLRLAKAIPDLATVDTAATAAEDAVGTLAAHRGRPDGLARLYVAIAQAGGVTARYVVGVLPRGDRILTHAWAEVWDADRHSWYAVDPVFGRAIAGAGLIRLGYAGSSYPDDMRPILSQARFTALDAMEAP